jgi:hypothetical protein
LPPLRAVCNAPVDPERPCEARGTRRALTLAALALPGIAHAVEVEDAGLLSSHYEEGGRSVWRGPTGTVKELAPIRVDSLQAGTGIRLTDRLKLAFTYLQDTWSGATPILTSPEAFLTVSGASAFPLSSGRTSRDLVPYGLNASGQRVPQPALVHMMTSASAETRRQAVATLTREWNEAALDVGVGLSEEPDFSSRFGQVNARWDFNQKLTSLTAGASYTQSNIDANLGPPTTWTDYGLYKDAPSGPRVTSVTVDGVTVQKFSGERSDWSASLGLKQVLDRNTTLSMGLTHISESGFLANPYKLVMLGFADPSTPPVLFNGLLVTRVFNVAESRPSRRNEWALNAALARYFAAPDAALRMSYRYAQDDWGIRSHTLEGAWSQALRRGWLVTPRVRYYSQTAADFYQPYFLLLQRAPVNAQGTLDFGRVPLQYYSSDHRLSGYGAVSGGLMVSKRFASGLRLEAGLEHYVHAGGLKLGGGEDSYADFKYWVFNLGLALDLTAASAVQAGERQRYAALGDHAHHSDDASEPHHADHLGGLLPAGVMGGDFMDQAGAFMLGYRFSLSRQAGRVLRGTQPASDADIAANACGAVGCTVAPKQMSMHMHMLDLMYAPADWFNLMAMFQFMDMDMTMRPLEGTVASGGGEHAHAGHDHHASGGPGDTSIGALFRLWSTGSQSLHFGLGISIPTGAVNKKTGAGEYLDYGMQLGSGTWDLQPSLTYNGRSGRWFWGAQLSGTKRLQSANRSGYALGDLFQATAWTGRSLTDWLAVTVRGLRTIQDAIDGQFNGPQMLMGPPDFPGNYGGRFSDLGLGLSFAVPGRAAHGDRINLEWLQPIGDSVNGYQLERSGSLSLNWRMMF